MLSLQSLLVFLWQLKMAAENPGTAAKEAYDEKVRLDAAAYAWISLDANRFL